MYQLEVQIFLQSGGTPEELTSRYGIRVKQHPKHSSLFHFCYDQIESPKDNSLVNDCRGLILDAKENWRVIAFPFRRFANHGESWAAPIDWESAVTTEKLDGSMICLWYYDREWNVSTKGSPDAGGNVGDFGFTFAELFWRTLKSQLPYWHRHLTEFFADFHEGHFRNMTSMNTWMWEITSMFNRVVCSYGSEPRLTLIGVRRLDDDLEEIPVAAFKDILPVVREFSLATVSDVIAASEQLDPIATEGFVVTDKDFNRLKIKSPRYVLLHHLRDGFGQRRIIGLIQLGESSEVLTYFPEFQSMFDEIKAKIDNYIAEVQADWESLKHICDRKAFALEAVKTRSPDCLFALHQGKANCVRDHILYSRRRDGTFTYTEEKIERLIGLKRKPAVQIEE